MTCLLRCGGLILFSSIPMTPPGYCWEQSNLPYFDQTVKYHFTDLDFLFSVSESILVFTLFLVQNSF